MYKAFIFSVLILMVTGLSIQAKDISDFKSDLNKASMKEAEAAGFDLMQKETEELDQVVSTIVAEAVQLKFAEQAKDENSSGVVVKKCHHGRKN